jgi:regulator of replication initiation timing
MKKDILEDLQNLDGIWGRVNQMEYTIGEIKKTINNAAREIIRLRKENEELKKK